MLVAILLGNGIVSAQVGAAGRDTDGAARLYLELCTGCHTIGGGELSGPDLEPSTRWPAGDLALAVERMEKNVGALTEEQVQSLVELLKDPDVSQRLAQAREAEERELEAAMEQPPSPERGRRLYDGALPFANDGMPCSACHAVAGRGGTLAADLTMAVERLGRSAVVKAAQKPGFPLMRAAYEAHPVTRQEALHVAAYLSSMEGAAETGREAAAVGGAGALVAGVALAGVAVVAGRRRTGVRRRLLDRAMGGDGR